MPEQEHSVGWASSRSYAQLSGGRLLVDYDFSVPAGERWQLFLSRVFNVLLDEEKRIYALTDDQVREELAPIKARAAFNAPAFNAGLRDVLTGNYSSPLRDIPVDSPTQRA